MLQCSSLFLVEALFEGNPSIVQAFRLAKLVDWRGKVQIASCPRSSGRLPVLCNQYHLHSCTLRVNRMIGSGDDARGQNMPEGPSLGNRTWASGAGCILSLYYLLLLL